jgi:hypothetical protein
VYRKHTAGKLFIEKLFSAKLFSSLLHFAISSRKKERREEVNSKLICFNDFVLEEEEVKKSPRSYIEKSFDMPSATEED